MLPSLARVLHGLPDQAMRSTPQTIACLPACPGPRPWDPAQDLSGKGMGLVCVILCFSLPVNPLQTLVVGVGEGWSWDMAILKMLWTVDRLFSKGLCGGYFRLSGPSGLPSQPCRHFSAKGATDNM